MSGAKKEELHLLLRIWPGLILVGGLALVALKLSEFEKMKALQISPLIIGIMLGIFVGNFFRTSIPPKCSLGIIFSTKRILRFGIVMYGFKITFQQLVAVGFDGLLVSVVMVTSTFILGSWLGMKLFGLDRDTAILTASGSAVCGAAAVMASESVLGAERHKSAVAVATVVLFGTISMFVYPLLYSSGWLGFSPQTFGIYVGGSVHEVAQVVAVGNVVDGAADNAVIVKMTRVMLIVPLLFCLSYWLRSKSRCLAVEGSSVDADTGIVEPRAGASGGLYIPWFAVLFVFMSGVNSLDIISPLAKEWILYIDVFALTMAMTALGLETNVTKFKEVGARPFYLAFLMFVWLLGAGYLLGRYVVEP